MNNKKRSRRLLMSVGGIWLLAGFLVLAIHSQALAFTLHVIDGDTNTPIAPAFRWMVEVDNTFDTVPGAAVTDQLSFSWLMALQQKGPRALALPLRALMWLWIRPVAITSQLCPTAVMPWAALRPRLMRPMSMFMSNLTRYQRRKFRSLHLRTTGQ